MAWFLSLKILFDGKFEGFLNNDRLSKNSDLLHQLIQGNDLVSALVINEYTFARIFVLAAKPFCILILVNFEFQNEANQLAGFYLVGALSTVLFSFSSYRLLFNALAVIQNVLLFIRDCSTYKSFSFLSRFLLSRFSVSWFMI